MATNSPTLLSVAKLAGVSTATVNRVLKGGYVSPDARAAVEEALSKTGYRPNTIARGLRTRRNYTVGQMLTAITVNPFFVNVAHGVEEAARTENYRTILFNHAGDPERERLGLERFIDDRVDAVLFCTSMKRSNFDLLDQAGIPYVEIERSRSGKVPAVRVDNYVGARLAMAHLAQLGHRRIAFVGGDPALFESDAVRDRSVEDDRLDAYRDGLAEIGLAPDPTLMRLGRYYLLSDGGSGAEGYRHTRALLELADRPTAIFATCDILAAGVLQAIYDANLRVPEDISVVGFDDTLAFNLSPSLTTVSQPMAELGAIGFSMALDLIEGRTPPREKILPSSLVVRSSTAPAAISH